MSQLTDTPPDIVAIVHERTMKLSGAERFIIGARMFETARAFVLASLPKNIPEAKRRQMLYARFYGELTKVGN
jgi:hypothetical protein